MDCNTRFPKHCIIVGLLFYFTFHKRRYRIFVIVGKSNPVLSDGFQVGVAAVTGVGNSFEIRIFRKKKIMRGTLNTIHKQLCSTIGIKSSAVIMLYFICNLLLNFLCTLFRLSYYLVCLKLLIS